jgi:hypothetical protein
LIGSARGLSTCWPLGLFHRYSPKNWISVSHVRLHHQPVRLEALADRVEPELPAVLAGDRVDPVLAVLELQRAAGRVVAVLRRRVDHRPPGPEPERGPHVVDVVRDVLDRHGPASAIEWNTSSTSSKPNQAAT